MSKSISNSDDVIDSRDVIERIEELRGELDGLVDAIQEAEEELEEKRDAAKHAREERDSAEDPDEDQVTELEEAVIEAETEVEEAAEALTEAREALADWLGVTVEIFEMDEGTMTAEDIKDRLKNELSECVGNDDNGAEELVALEALAEKAEGYASDWRHGETLIHEDHFEDYARELADELGYLEGTRNWPLNHIDWKAAAEELKGDYTSVEFDGQSYYVR